MVPVPSVILTGSPIFAGYDETLGATVAAVPYAKQLFSLVLILPGKPAEYIAGGLSRIESKLTNELWTTIMKRLQIVEHVSIQVPTLRHR